MELVINFQDADKPLVQQLHEQAAQRNISLDALVLDLVRLGLIISQSKSRLQTYHDLDDLAGTWSEQDAEAFERVIADFAVVDDLAVGASLADLW
jgi:hypothetical protein